MERSKQTMPDSPQPARPLWRFTKIIADFGSFVTFIILVVTLFHPVNQAALVLLIVAIFVAAAVVAVLWQTRATITRWRYGFMIASLVVSLVASAIASYNLAVPAAPAATPRDSAGFSKPGDGAQIGLCLRPGDIEGWAPTPSDGARYYLTQQKLDTPGAHIWLAARLTVSDGSWKLPAQINIGSAADAANGEYRLSLVRANKDLTVEYEGRFARAENGDGNAQDIGVAFPGGIDTVNINVHRVRSTCP
jgi:hypothetical protein